MSPIDLYDLFVFDLDGTLADTGDDLSASLNHALSLLGREPLSREAVVACVGHGARKLVARALGSEIHAAPGDPRAGEVELALSAFLAHYREHCAVDTRAYPDVLETLERLRAAGKRLAVLTNKPLEHSLKILEALGLGAFFAQIEGGDSVPEKKPHPAGLLKIVHGAGERPRRALLVGDSNADLFAARAAGVAVALVEYGFEAPALWQAAPDHRLTSLRELIDAPCPRPSPGSASAGSAGSAAAPVAPRPESG